MIERWVQHITDPDASAAEVKKQLERVCQLLKEVSGYSRTPRPGVAQAAWGSTSSTQLEFGRGPSPQPRFDEAAKSYQRDPDEETSRLASAICMNISLVLLNIENDTDPRPRLRACANGLRGFNV